MKTVETFFLQNRGILICWFDSKSDFIYAAQKRAKDWTNESSVLESAKLILADIME